MSAANITWIRIYDKTFMIDYDRVVERVDLLPTIEVATKTGTLLTARVGCIRPIDLA